MPLSFAKFYASVCSRNGQKIKSSPSNITHQLSLVPSLSAFWDMLPNPGACRDIGPRGPKDGNSRERA